MYARVLRLTDVSAERIAEVIARVEESEGPPPGVDCGLPRDSDCR